MNKENNKRNTNKNANNKSRNKNTNSVNQLSAISPLRLAIIGAVITFILLLLIARIAWLQFIDSSWLQEKVYRQQTINEIISPKRGNIYDSTGKALAISAAVDTITINPLKITDEKKEIVAKGLSEIFELDYEETLAKVKNNTQVETIIKKVENEKVDKLKKWMTDNKISVGINIDEDTKRYYPYSTLASNLIGFCGTDNIGLSGIEYAWNDVLTGTSGKIVSSKDAKKSEIPNSEQTYIAPENGSNITLSIDFNIQSVVEKYLKQAVENYNCEKGGNAIVMDPTTGDILAMASYPDYDLNTPFTPNYTISQNWDTLSASEKTNRLNIMWKNRSISETYEPGSVFKIITASIGLEEGVTKADTAGDYYCSGVEKVLDRDIRCWRRNNPHFSQSLRLAFCNSCNPAFIQLGQRIGVSTFYKYCSAFGLFDKTNIALSGEAKGIFNPQNNVGAVELATMSFGQRFTITPLEMITAASAVVNNGNLMQPRIVKEITNIDTNESTIINPVKVRQVISSETSAIMRSIMESDVTVGTGKNASVKGYSIGGKTGTSEPIASKIDEEGYVASFLAISPIENTKVVLLVTLYKPNNNNNQYQGGQISAPVASQILSEILPYLGITSDEDSQGEDKNTSNIKVPDLKGKTVAEAKALLDSANLKANFTITENESSAIITDQVPKPGVLLSKNSIVMLYTSEHQSKKNTSVVPDLKGMTLVQAKATLEKANLNINITGTGVVFTQDYLKNTTVDSGTVISVTLKEQLTDAH
ncbi:Stage V sporulation protein D [compost metagenome]